jgi:hypothetical protein
VVVDVVDRATGESVVTEPDDVTTRRLLAIESET